MTLSWQRDLCVSFRHRRSQHLIQHWLQLKVLLLLLLLFLKTLQNKTQNIALLAGANKPTGKSFKILQYDFWILIIRSRNQLQHRDQCHVAVSLKAQLVRPIIITLSQFLVSTYFSQILQYNISITILVSFQCISQYIDYDFRVEKGFERLETSQIKGFFL